MHLNYDAMESIIALYDHPWKQLKPKPLLSFDSLYFQNTGDQFLSKNEHPFFEKLVSHDTGNILYLNLYFQYAAAECFPYIVGIGYTLDFQHVTQFVYSAFAWWWKIHCRWMAAAYFVYKRRNLRDKILQ